MRNTKELKAILTAIYCINRTNGTNDKDISNILDYAFNRCLGCNTNILTLICAGKTKEEIMPTIEQLLSEDTKYKE